MGVSLLDFTFYVQRFVSWLPQGGAHKRRLTPGSDPVCACGCSCGCAGSLAVAVSLLGFAFYIQPLMMPLLNEMPGTARSQARILSWAMRFTVVSMYPRADARPKPFSPTLSLVCLFAVFGSGVCVVMGILGLTRSSSPLSPCPCCLPLPLVCPWAVFAGGVYVVIGFFGAAWYGAATEGNILQNVLLGGGVGQCVLNFLMAGEHRIRC